MAKSTAAISMRGPQILVLSGDERARMCSDFPVRTLDFPPGGGMEKRHIRQVEDSKNVIL